MSATFEAETKLAVATGVVTPAGFTFQLVRRVLNRVECGGGVVVVVVVESEPDRCLMCGDTTGQPKADVGPARSTR